MSSLNLVKGLTVRLLQPTAGYLEPIQLKIKFYTKENITKDILFRVKWIRSDYADQLLEEVVVNVPRPAKYKFKITCPAPDPTTIPQNDVVGITCVLVEALAEQQVFWQFPILATVTDPSNRLGMDEMEVSGDDLKDEDLLHEDEEDLGDEEEDDDLAGFIVPDGTAEEEVSEDWEQPPPKQPEPKAEAQPARETVRAEPVEYATRELVEGCVRELVPEPKLARETPDVEQLLVE